MINIFILYIYFLRLTVISIINRPHATTGRNNITKSAAEAYRSSVLNPLDAEQHQQLAADLKGRTTKYKHISDMEIAGEIKTYLSEHLMDYHNKSKGERHTGGHGHH